MKHLLLGLALWIGAVQTVSFTNCCQGSFCSQKDNCPACPENGSHGPDDCCGTGIPPKAGEPGCVHLEPSLEVDSGIMPHLDFLVAAWIVFIAQSELPVHVHLPEATLRTSRGDSPPESPPPLYLRNLALLI
jgi:hypothetical protein